MSYYPDDGRDPLVSKYHKTLNATRVAEDPDDIDSDRVPYEDLQKSPNGFTGRFDVALDQGTLDICSHEHYYPTPVAYLAIRNRNKADGSKETVVALHAYAHKEEV